MKNYPLYESPYSATLRELLDGAAGRYGDKDAFLFRAGGEIKTVSYRSFRKQAFILGGALARRRLLQKQAAILGENSYQWLLAYFAVGCYGGVAVALDRDQPVEALNGMLEYAGCGVLFYSKEYAPVALELSKTQPELTMIPMEGEGLPGEIPMDLLLEEDDAEELPILNPDAPLEIIFTSGTTSRSKAVLLSHRNVVSNACYASNMVDIRSTDRVLASLPFHHTYELTCGVLDMMNQGCTIFINSSMKRLLADIAEFRPTMMVVVPLMLEMLLERIWDVARRSGKEKQLGRLVAFSKWMQKLGFTQPMPRTQQIKDSFGGNLRTIICGGAPLAREVVEDINAMGIRVVQGYGITECSPLVAVNRDRFFKTASVGMPIPGCEVRVDEGEILVRGENVMLGYYKDPAATAAAMRDGWFCTGDLGEIDAEGFVYLQGRKKNLIVLKNGKNISPEELEAGLLGCALIKECVVYGVEGGRNADVTLSATVYPDYQHPRLQGLLNHEVLALINSEVEKLNRQYPIYKQIRNVKLREMEFEKTTTHKIKRTQVL
jgi:long-chain acyl-CoA synthetase